MKNSEKQIEDIDMYTHLILYGKLCSFLIIVIKSLMLLTLYIRSNYHSFVSGGLVATYPASFLSVFFLLSKFE